MQPIAGPVGLATVLTLILAGCAGHGRSPASPLSRGASPSPSVPPPTFTGQLLVAESDSLALATQGENGKIRVTTKVPVATDAQDFTVSPDRRTVAYRQGTAIYTRPTTGGVERKVAGDAWDTTSSCLRWAPDGRYLTYRRAEDLVVNDLAGHVTVVDKVKKQDYSLAGLGGAEVHATSQLTCGNWLDARRLAFDRVKKMPESVRVEPGAGTTTVNADTTTVAVLGGKSTRLVDSPDTWEMVGSCGTRVVTRGWADGEPLHLLDKVSDANLSAGGAMAGAGSVVDRSTDKDSRIVFAPGSCQPLLYVPKDHTLRSVDPASRKVDAQPLITFPEDLSEGFSPSAYPAAWHGGDAFFDTDVSPTDHVGPLMLVDLKAHTATRLPADDTDRIYDVLAWLP